MSGEHPSEELPAPRDEPRGERDEEIPIPEYDAEQYIPRAERVSQAHRKMLREEFGYIRTFFKTRPENHWRLQRHLNQARMGTTYDVYLTKTVAYATGAGLLGALLGLVVTMLLATAGILSGLESPFSLEGDLVRFVASNRVFFAGALITLLSSLILAAITWVTRYYYPRIVVNSRRRNIDVMLPHTIVYMYALSFGGMDFAEVLRRSADAEGTYGEAANEFDTVVRDVEIFGNDLFTAIRNARNLTPSDNFEQFLDDLLSVLDSGGDVTAFLRDESEKYMEQAKREQEGFLDTLSTLSEVFIVGFVAAPLFVVVTLMLISFLGGGTVPMLFVFVYAILPLGMGAFLVVLSVLSEPYNQPPHELGEGPRTDVRVPNDLARTHPGYEAFRSIRRREYFRNLLAKPVETLKRQPLFTLGLSVPAATLAVGALITTTKAAPTIDAFLDGPYWTTTLLVVIPFLVVSVPLAAFHELGRRRKRHVARRLPDALDILASANQMGIRIVEGLELVARNLTGPFATELRKTRNDIHWNHDIRAALLGLADRLAVPQLTRTCKILAEGSRSTGDLYRILDVAAEDTRHRYWLERNRNQAMNAYIAIVIVGFLVYLGTIVIIDTSFLTPFAQIAETGNSEGAPGPVNLSTDAIDTYHLLFFHSALVQGVGTGAIAGKLSDNSVLTGLKYSIVLVLLAVVVFSIL